MPDLEDVSQAALLLAWLRDHPAVTAEAGEGRVGGVVEAPWPRCVITPGLGADLPDLRHRSTREVVIEWYGHPDGRDGQARMERLCLVTLRAARELAEREDHVPGEPVVTRVAGPGSLGPSPLVTGQPRWRTSVYVTAHPG